MPTGAPIPTIGPLPTASAPGKPTPSAPAPSRSSSSAPAPAPRPPTGGAPGPDNTGVPAGTKLTAHQGDLTVTKDDTVVDTMDIHGFLIIQANRVTVRNSMIRGTYAPGPGGKALVADYGNNTGLVIEDSTLRPDKPSAYVDGLKGRNFTARRLDISNTVDTAQIFGGTSTTIEDSWLHDLAYYSPYPLQPDNQTHNDGVQIEGGQNILLQNNTIERAHNSAIMVTQNYARTSNVQVVSNRLSGGNVCTVNLSEKGKGPIVGFTLKSNTFGPDLGQNGCAVIAPTSSPVTMIGNVLDSGGAVSVRKGA
jgi:hypothetical protein